MNLNNLKLWVNAKILCISESYLKELTSPKNNYIYVIIIIIIIGCSVLRVHYDFVDI